MGRTDRGVIKKYVVFDIETLPDSINKNALYGEPCFISWADASAAYGIPQEDLTAFFLDVLLTEKYTNHIIYAHNGFGFDYKRLSFARLVDLGFEGQIIRDKNNNYKAINLQKDGLKWSLQDTLVKFPSKLSELLKAFAPDFQKKDLDFERQDFDSSNQSHIEYAIRDSEGLYKAIEKIDELFKKIFDISFHDAMTAPGLSYKAFEKFCKSKKTEIPTLPDEIQAIAYEAYFGGQTLAFDCNIHADVMALDIHSSYGAVMLNNPMPCGMSKRIRFDGYEPKPSDGQIYYADIFCPENVTPVLKARIEKNGKIRKGNFSGNFSGWYFGEELKLARKAGIEVGIKEKVEFSSETDILQQFIQKLIGLRDIKYSPEDALGKLLQNSLYGKFASTTSDEDLILSANPPDGAMPFYDAESGDYPEILWLVKNERLQRKKPVHWGSYITALARVKLNDAILRKPEVVLYCDTDSIFFEIRYLKHFEDLIGPDYGQWGIEEGKRGTFRAYGAKAYQIGLERKNKGIPRKRFVDLLKKIKMEHPELSASEWSTKLAQITVVSYNQFNGIHQVLRGKNYGQVSSRACARPEKITVGYFDDRGKWHPEKANDATNCVERQGRIA